HTHDFDTAILGFIFKKLKGIKWVYDVHDLYESLVKKVSPNFSSKVVGAIDAFLQKNSDVVLTASDRVSDIIFGRNKNVYTILNTVSPISCEKKPRSEMFTVFYGGVLSGYRFLIEMLKISKKLGIRYRVAGKGWKKIEETLKEQLNGDYLGFIPHNQVFEELCKANLTFAIYDPKFENNRRSIPNKIFEAASVKTPILVAEGTALAHLVREMRIGWAVPYDPVAVENNLRELSTNPKFLKKAGYLGHKSYLSKYTWGTMEKVLVEKAYRGIKNV
ncbi:glycosyltransferase family protein, partial [Thermococcus sp.]